MELNELSKRIHQNAKDKGFWDEPREIGTLLMLCVSELSEALEADRKDNYCDFNGYEKYKKEETELRIKQEIGELPVRSPLLIKTPEQIQIEAFEIYIKNTFEDELADTIIRILDIYCARNIDIEKHIELKIKYNQSRERLHGKKY